MNKTKISFFWLVAVLLVLGPAFVSSVEAQCTSVRVFASAGTGAAYDNVRIDAGTAENAGNEIGRFWQSSNSNLGNNFNGGCPSQDGEASWWQVNPSLLRRIEGWIGVSWSDGTICAPVSCPMGDMTLVVEETTPSGDDALFIGFRVDETPPSLRWWDFSRVDPSPSPSVLTMRPYPQLDVLSSSSLGGGLIRLDLLLSDVASNVHAVNGPGDDPLPASSVVASYDVYVHQGPEDPGRDVASWTLLERIPYEDGPVTISVDVSCEDDSKLALGLSFEGGDGPDVVSSYVGKSTAIECGLDPPVTADAGPDRVVECSGPEGTPVTLDGSGTVGAFEVEWRADGVVFDDPHVLMPTGLFPVGTTEVRLIAWADPYVDVDSTLVTVLDETEPALTCGLSAASGGDDDEGDDSIRLSISIAADDVCCGEPEVAVEIALGWASLPVVDGQVITLQCPGTGDDDPSDCPRVGNCDGHLTIRSTGATLAGVATDCNGNVATCELDLCATTPGSSQLGVEATPVGDREPREFDFTGR